MFTNTQINNFKWVVFFIQIFDLRAQQIPKQNQIKTRFSIFNLWTMQMVVDLIYGNSTQQRILII